MRMAIAGFSGYGHFHCLVLQLHCERDEVADARSPRAKDFLGGPLSLFGIVLTAAPP